MINMTLQKIKNNTGFVLLFAVTISAILLAVALGVSNVAYKEVKFGTSAKDTNDAFFAADTATEYMLYQDKPSPGPGPLPTPSAGNTSTNYYTVTGLGNSGNGCALITVFKDNTSPPTIKTKITSKGYDSGDVNCASTNPDRIEREIEVNY